MSTKVRTASTKTTAPPTIQAIFDSEEPEYDLDFDGDKREPIIGVSKPEDGSDPHEISTWSITKTVLTAMDGSEGGKTISPPAFMLCADADAVPPGTLEAAADKVACMPMLSKLFPPNAAGKMEASIMVPSQNTELVEALQSLHIAAGEHLGGDYDLLHDQLIEGDKELTIECGGPGVEKTDPIKFKFLSKHGDDENSYFTVQVFPNTPVSLFVLNEDKTDFARNALGQPELMTTTLEDLPDGGQGLRIHAMLNIEGTTKWNVFKNKEIISSLRLKLRTAMCYPKELAPHKDNAIAELTAGYAAQWAADIASQSAVKAKATTKAKPKAKPNDGAPRKALGTATDKKKRKLEELSKEIEAEAAAGRTKVPKLGRPKKRTSKTSPDKVDKSDLADTEEDEPQEP